MKIALVIVTFDGTEKLRRHLGALISQSRKPDEIFIVNTGKRPVNLSGVVSGLPITVLDFDNIGPAGGFRRGGRAAYDSGSDYIIFADDDAVPCGSGTFARLESHAKAGIAAVSGAYPDGVPITLANHYLMVSRLTIERLGLYFEPFFLMCEDMEYFERVRRGVGVLHDLSIRIDHPFRMPGDSFRTYLIVRNYFIHMALSGSARAFAAIFVCYFLRCLYLAPREPGFFLAFARGVVDFAFGKTGRQAVPSKELAFGESGRPENGLLFGGGPELSGTPLEGLERWNTDIFGPVMDGREVSGPIRSFVDANMAAAGRDVVLAGDFFLAYPPFSLAARDIFAYEKGRFLHVRRNNPALSVLFTAAALPLSLILLPPALLAFHFRRGELRRMLERQVQEDSAHAGGYA